MFSTSVPALKVALVVPSYGWKPSYKVPLSAESAPERSRRNGMTVPSFVVRDASQRPSIGLGVSASAAPPAQRITAARPVVCNRILMTAFLDVNTAIVSDVGWNSRRASDGSHGHSPATPRAAPPSSAAGPPAPPDGPAR